MLLLENDFVAITFAKEAGWIRSIYDKVRKIEFIPQGYKADPFRLEFEGKLTNKFQLFNYEYIKQTEDIFGYKFTWILSESITICATIQLNYESDEVHFYCYVDNQSDEPIISLEYPIIPNIDVITNDGRDDYLVHSFATGFQINNPLKHFTKDWNVLRYMPYPEGFSGSTMQFFSYYGLKKGGLYFAAYDSEGYAKWLNFYKNENKLLEASFIHGCEEIAPKKGIHLDYPIVIKLLEGNDWYEAADIYKNWAHNQYWCRQGKLIDADEHEKASWLIEDIGVSTFGINASYDRSEWLNTYHNHIDTKIFHILGPDWPKKTQDFRGVVPGGIQDWFPTRFSKKNIDTIKELGDKYAPFEFDYLFNIEGADGEQGEKAMQKIPLPPKSIDKYSFPFVCPATPYVQNLHVQRDQRLQEDVQIDAMYYDISANNILKVCMDETHGHSKGAGRQITLAYRENYKNTKAALQKNPDYPYVPIGTEMINEVFIDVLDFYQARAGAQPAAPLEGWNIKKLLKTGDAKLIPMFTYVYHEYGPVRLDGWGKMVEEIGDLFYFTVARTYLWGGIYELNYEYSPMEAIDGQENDPDEHYYTFDSQGYEFSPDRAHYISQFAKLRTGVGNKYLAYGKMLRPLEFECEYITLDWFHYNCNKHSDEYNDSGSLTVKSIVHSAWQYSDESIGLFFANVSDHDQKITFEINVGLYTLEQNPSVLYNVSTSEKVKLLDINPNDNIKNVHLTVPSKNVVCLEIR